MKLNITVDLEDLYIHEDNTFNEALEHKIKKEVIQDIWQTLKAKVEDQIVRNVATEIEKQYCKKIQLFIAEFFQSGKVKYGYDKETVTIEQYIVKTFENNQGWNNPKEQIEKLAAAHGKTLKDRYDLLFASQLVVKLNENGLLKEDVAKTLLNNN